MLSLPALITVTFTEVTSTVMPDVLQESSAARPGELVHDVQRDVLGEGRS
jgi:hypothetical protein